MRKHPVSLVVALTLGLVVGGVAAPARADNPLRLLPTPKVLKVQDGRVPLTADSRIVAADEALKPLAAILSQEIWMFTGFHPAMAPGPARAGDVVLAINPKIQADEDILTVRGQDVLKTRDMAHTLAVTDRTVIEGWDYRAVCEGTATFLQAVVEDGGAFFVPKMTVKDWPYADYTSTMPDCARQRQPIYALKTVVDSCRFFKIRYLHLHLNDDSAFTFPSKAYPQVTRCNGKVGAYTLEELKDLVTYADARGVTCVPEIDAPAHCSSLLSAMGGKLGSASQRVMDVLNPDIYPILDTIVGEMCDVFKSSPYFHIGGDEVEPAWYLGNAHVKAYMKEHNIGAADKPMLFLPYAQEMAKIVKKHGKKTIMWEGCPIGPPLHPSLAKDVIVYTWYPRSGGARRAQELGFTTITVPWEIKIPFAKWSMFHSNGHDLDPKKDRVLGACRPMWEMDHVALANGYMHGVGERQERTWGPFNEIEPDYKARMARQNARADAIYRPVKYALDGEVTKHRTFAAPATLTLSARAAGLQIRYQLDGNEPTAHSPLYEKPFRAAESLYLRAGLFDAGGRQVGNTTIGETYQYRGKVPNLALDKPVETSRPGNAKEKPEYAVDGIVDIGQYWGTKPAPAWIKVDLQAEHTIARVQVVPFFDGMRYYQYTVEASLDGTNWTMIVDGSGNKTPGTDKGYTHAFAPVKARYVKVNLLKNSDNPAVHLVEFRVFPAGELTQNPK
ncbi:MAG: family 20 glycosylhydrolase [Planctomycetota bacterium]|nr:family 20 glycosylhydrolase [Planctomycetota bacterium]